MANVPFDVANNLSDVERQAWLIIIGELNGGKFNWRTMTWDKPDA